MVRRTEVSNRSIGQTLRNRGNLMNVPYITNISHQTKWILDTYKLFVRKNKTYSVVTWQRSLYKKRKKYNTFPSIKISQEYTERKQKVNFKILNLTLRKIRRHLHEDFLIHPLSINNYSDVKWLSNKIGQLLRRIVRVES